MHFEILKPFTCRSVNFKAGQTVLEGDFPPQELFPWCKAGFAKQHGELDLAPYKHPDDAPPAPPVEDGPEES